MLVFAGLALFALSWNQQARAQSEVAPDHFGSPNEEPLSARRILSESAASTERFYGTLTLPHRVQCNGKSLTSGKYSVALRSDGTMALLVLNRSGRATKLEGFAHRQVQNAERDTVIVERNGNVRRILEVRLQGLHLVFQPDAPVPASSRKRTSIEEIPLRSTAARN
jgi:hypothetical protein